MAFSISNGASASGDSFNKKEHMSAAAILFEPTGVRTGIQTQYGQADFTDGNITIFSSEGEIESGKPSIVLKNAGVGGALGKSIAGYVGGATVGKLTEQPSKKGNPAIILAPIPQAQVDKIVEYVEAREAARQAELPSFLQG